MNNILVVGGTGWLGKELVAQLLKKGKNVFVLTRHPKKNTVLSDAGAVLLEGDLTDPISLKKACAGKDAVISSAHSLLGSGKYASEKVDELGQKALLDAANTEGVPYFVLVSVTGASPDHITLYVRPLLWSSISAK
jgi:uncharacterized protein YbjT (DUF2867 family)